MAFEFQKSSPGKGGGWEIRTRAVTVNTKFDYDESTVCLHQLRFLLTEGQEVSVKTESLDFGGVLEEVALCLSL